MPEGPTILMLGEEVQVFVGKVVRSATGSAGIDLGRVEGRKLLEVRTWGKHLLLRFSGFTVRVHLLLFGSYRIDESREGRRPTMRLQFATGELSFYASSVKLIEGDLDAAYDWRADVISDAWDPALARNKLAAAPDTLACDALMDQDTFAGVGNIIKNETLFRARLHPLSRMGAVPARQRAKLVDEARRFSFDFLSGKRAGTLDRYLQVHGKETCPRCGGLLQSAVLGKTQRRAFWCDACQVRHDLPSAAPSGRSRTTSSKPKKKKRPDQ